ncbi:transcription-repair coupling factor, partial [filamentous cyanobacterium CCP5]
MLSKLEQQSKIHLNGVPRLPKGLVVSALAQVQEKPLLVVTATLEEAGRWAAQLEAMGWGTVQFYPTSESSPYDPFDQESEMTWGQLQVLADLQLGASQSWRYAIVTTERALQPHLPPVSAFEPYCLKLQKDQSINLKTLSQRLARLGYDRVSTVETEGQWAQRGDIIDVFPVASELPVRLELFGDELERLREFDPGTQRSLDAIDQLVLTPTDYAPIIMEALQETGLTDKLLSEEAREGLAEGILPEGTRRWLGLAFDHPASLLDYLPESLLVALDEPDQCRAHSDLWVEHVEDHWQSLESEIAIPRLHRPFTENLELAEVFPQVHLTELAEESKGLNLASRPVPVLPHQFGKLAQTLKVERDRNFSIWLVSAQPSRSASLLQEHDCP